MKKILFPIMLLINFYEAEAAACSCAAPDSIAKAYQSANVVYIAYVDAIEALPNSETGRLAIKTKVEENLKGLEWQPEVTLYGEAYSAACGYPFNVDETYLVYAYINVDGQLETNHCLRTKPIHEAYEEIEELRKIALGDEKKLAYR